MSLGVSFYCFAKNRHVLRILEDTKEGTALRSQGWLLKNINATLKTQGVKRWCDAGTIMGPGIEPIPGAMCYHPSVTLAPSSMCGPLPQWITAGPVGPIKYDGNDIMWLSRLDHKQYCRFHLDLLDLYGDPSIMLLGGNMDLWRGPYREKSETPAVTQHQLASHMSHIESECGSSHQIIALIMFSFCISIIPQ